LRAFFISNLENTTEKKQTFFERFRKRIRDKYRLVIMNDDTFEEQASFVLSPFNVFVFAGALTLFLIVSVTYLIAFTSLREYIPGYADVSIRRDLIKVNMRVDSLENELELKDFYLRNLSNIISGEVVDPTQSIKPNRDSTRRYDRMEIRPSTEDSMMRAQIEEEERNMIRLREGSRANQGIKSFFFFVPLSGIAINKFKSTPDHFGVDIAAKRNDIVKSTLDGTVTLATWTPQTGYVIQVQHDGNLISIYKHNSALLKKPGERVKAGEPVAIVGDTGEHSSGIHLHFELWYKGIPIDPQDYISF
jgi:hypothetical protein